MPQFAPLVDFFISHHIMFHSDNSDKMIIKDMTGTFYPIDHVHIGLQMIMYGISVLGEGNHMNCRQAWNLIESKRNPEGRYILTESFPKPYFNVGLVGEPNKWVTLYVLLSKMYSSTPE